MLNVFTKGIIDSPRETIKKSLKTLRDIETIFEDKVYPVPGSVVLCDLVAGEYHSGIYVGNNRIVHLEGNGDICSVSPERFLKRLGGFTGACSIFVSCGEDGEPVGNAETAERAISMAGENRDYHLLLDNCHQFTSGCITGDFDNSENFTMLLKSTSKELFGAEKWLLWKGYDKTDIIGIRSIGDGIILR